MKKYEFSIHYKILILLFLIVITGLSFPPYDDYRNIIIVLACIYIWCQVIRIPYIVTVDDSGKIIFKSIFKSTEISAINISKIEDSILTYKVIHNKGSINVSTLMDNAYGLKKRIESTNSSIESEDRKTGGSGLHS